MVCLLATPFVVKKEDYMYSCVVRHIVTEIENGCTVEQICRKKYDISARLLTELKRTDGLHLNGEHIRSIDTVSTGDVLTIDLTENNVSENVEPVKMALDIVYDDDFLTVVNKPRNMCMHPSIGNYLNTLANGIVYYWQTKGENHKFHAVNRIDRDTSGLCIIAKNRFSHGILSEQTKNKTLHKTYFAIVNGNIKDMSGTICAPIARAEEGIIKRTVSPDGKPAITHYTVIEKNDELSFLKIQTETGRTHQIRVHFSSIGYPLLGDSLYGCEKNDNITLKGHLLHCGELMFKHPLSKETMHFSADIPQDMKQFFQFEH